ncbi:putative RING-H2 finger protein ATL21A [Rhododendron vialii]|uniref:putative RING-H2 finger protein ATL21A n=1 Tax=Rhododendron vialii TaxID=182163 RepID=UPI00265F60F0|nr:putative RING-H2 finger protein ATL21A [Rhododendron vialii]
MTKNKLMVLFFFFFFLLLSGVGAQADDRDRGDECLPTSCGDEGPEIRFPFWLKDHQPDHCGYGPDFALTCSPANNETLLDNPFSVKVVVESIDYHCQYVWYELSGDYALHQKNLSLIFDTSAFSPFQLLSNIGPGYRVFGCRFYLVYPYDALCEYSVFSCLSSWEDSYGIYEEYTPLPCLSRQGQNLYLLNSDYLIRRNLLKNCKKIDTIPSIPRLHLFETGYNYGCSRGRSAWSEPSCGKCEEQGQYCRLSSSNNSKKHETECFGTIPQPDNTNYHMPPGGTSHPSEEKEEYLLHFPRAFILFDSSINEKIQHKLLQVGF